LIHEAMIKLKEW